MRARPESRKGILVYMPGRTNPSVDVSRIRGPKRIGEWAKFVCVFYACVGVWYESRFDSLQALNDETAEKIRTPLAPGGDARGRDRMDDAANY